MRKKFLKLRRLALGTILSGAVAPTYSISGTVYDADGSTPVSGATVALGALTATSAANGTYTISNIPADTTGGYTCTKTGYVWAAKALEPISGNLTGQDFINDWYASGGISASVIAAYRALGAVNKAASIASLVGSNNLAEQGTVTFDAASGWSGFSADNYLNGSYNWSTSYTYALRVSDCPAVVGYKRALFAGDAEQIFIVPYTDDNVNAFSANNGSNWTYPRIQSGVIIVTPTKCYVNGVAATQGAYGGAYTGTTWKVGHGPDTNFFGGKIQLLEIVNGDLTEAQILILNTAMGGVSNP